MHDALLFLFESCDFYPNLEKTENPIPQGLKPLRSHDLASELKLRPPKPHLSGGLCRFPFGGLLQGVAVDLGHLQHGLHG
ncbi:MAG TPA: hypothetical protein VNY24_07445, partial [Candidatus Acidoferrales bacterium]|nr:hypothetical protein [Candidatus Acidoferrales bacterium]